MQSVTKAANNPVFWGAITLVVIMVVSIGVAYVYVKPPGEKIVTFYTDDAMSVRAGDTVRIAGIVVGKVKDLSLEPDRVRVRAGVEASAFVGDQSQVEVRMLTVVGGYYVTINSLGDAPLDDHPIPEERVTMPYSLTRIMADSTKITRHVATAPVNETMTRIQEGLVGTNTDALAQLINAGNSITDALNRQRGQISRILDVSNEYVDRMNKDRELLVYLISRIAILEQTLTLYGKGFGDSLAGMGELGKRLDVVSVFYMNHRNDFIERIRGVLGEFQAIADRNGAVVGLLRRVRERMEHTLVAQDAFATRPTFGGAPPAPELFATDLCVPLEGSRC